MAQLQRAHVILICGFNIVSSPVAVVGNALIIATIWRNSSLRTPSYIFLDGIAITDFFTGLITQPAFNNNNNLNIFMQDCCFSFKKKTAINAGPVKN